MQTYAVVDADFRFVKIGRTSDLESRLATLNTASPRPLILMALFDGDIEQDMHRMLAQFRERLEWFQYNEQTEGVIIARMTPTREWFHARKLERKRRRKLDGVEQMGPVIVSSFDRRQRDQVCGVVPTGTLNPLGALFGIPDEPVLVAVVERANKGELIQTRKALSECGRRVRDEMESIARDVAPSPDRMTRALFARALIKNWKRRVGMELGAIIKSYTSIT